MYLSHWRASTCGPSWLKRVHPRSPRTICCQSSVTMAPQEVCRCFFSCGGLIFFSLILNVYKLFIGSVLSVRAVSWCCLSYAAGGHYTAYCQNVINGQWYEFDDQYVSEVHETVVQNAEAYVLFYRWACEDSWSVSYLYTYSLHWLNDSRVPAWCRKSSEESVRVRQKVVALANMKEPSLLQFYISREWLNKFNTFAEPGPISNHTFLCQHGGDRTLLCFITPRKWSVYFQEICKKSDREEDSAIILHCIPLLLELDLYQCLFVPQSSFQTIGALFKKQTVRKKLHVNINDHVINVVDRYQLSVNYFTRDSEQSLTFQSPEILLLCPSLILSAQQWNTVQTGGCCWHLFIFSAPRTDNSCSQAKRNQPPTNLCFIPIILNQNDFLAGCFYIVVWFVLTC